MKNKYWFDAFVGVVGGAVSTLFGGFDSLFIALCVSMVIDIFLGTACGWLGLSNKSEKGKIESRAFIKGVLRKVYELSIIAISVQIDIILGTGFCRNGAVIAFFCGEVISITENGGLLGVPLPKPIRQAIEILNKKGDENEDRN